MLITVMLQLTMAHLHLVLQILHSSSSQVQVKLVFGDALTKTGNQLDVAVDDSSIEVSSDALQVKALVLQMAC